MVHYETSAHWERIIKAKYGRYPKMLPYQDGCVYEDLEYQRSLAYEEGKMVAMMPTEREKKRMIRARLSQHIKNGLYSAGVKSVIGTTKEK